MKMLLICSSSVESRDSPKIPKKKHDLFYHHQVCVDGYSVVSSPQAFFNPAQDVRVLGIGQPGCSHVSLQLPIVSEEGVRERESSGNDVDVYELIILINYNY